MALPSSGTLEMSRIAVTDGANSVGVVTPYSLFQLSKLTGCNGYWDGGWFWGNIAVSGFYSWKGYGFQYGSPSILHDYGLSSRYSTSSSNIIDTSGNGRTGTFVSGTGNGTAVNIPSGYYNTGFPGNIVTNDPSQYAIRLNDVAKYGGTASFTWVTWFKVSSFSTNFPGLIANEGRSSGVPIGHSMYISNSGGIALNYQRWNGTTNSGTTNTVTFGSGGVPAFSYNKWYMAAVTFNGSTATLYLFVNGDAYTNAVSTSSSVTTDASWGVFNGLRYNNWLNGSFGYTACYSSVLGIYDLYDFNSMTRTRYDY